MSRRERRDQVSRTVLLFYDGFELRAREGRMAALYHVLRSRVRFIYGALRGKHNKSGFWVAFQGLRTALIGAGYDVRVNDFRAARAEPGHPIGVAGYPTVLDHVRLPNPMIFGPGDPGYPPESAALADQEQVRKIIQPSDWFVDYYRPFCGDKMLRCPIGIDIDEFGDTGAEPKTTDVLIYDKIRWYRDTLVDTVRERLVRHLEARGLTYEVLVYGQHPKKRYMAALRRSRTMAFLCEHETQGLAYAEALATDVPVFAWDEGVLVDPLQREHLTSEIRVSSVPYFDRRCGVRFTLDDMEARFDEFWSARTGYRPRDYIRESLSPDTTAAIYMAAYDDARS